MAAGSDLVQAVRRPLTADERRFYREWLIIAVLCLSTLSLFTVMQWGQSAGLVIFDQFQRAWPAHPGNDIVVVEVDDRTIETRGGWPIRRSLYTQLLQQLADSGNTPRAIGFDILFPDPRPEDAALAEQMKRHKVYLAAEFPHVLNSGQQQRQVSPVLAEAAAGLAHVNLSFEADGGLRGTRLLIDGVPQLALAMSARQIPELEANNSYRRLHLVHPEVGFPSASLADVLSGAVPLELFRDKYVLIGSTAPSLGDHFPTIHSGEQAAGTPGVMLHANLLSNILRDELIRPLPAWGQLLLSWLSIGMALLALLVLSPLAELLVSVLIASCTLALSFALVVLAHRWFDPGLCLIAIAMLKPAWTWRRSEMIVRFMSERATRLDHSHHRKTLRDGLRLRHFASDTLLQYSRVLDKAIAMVSDRLSFLQRLVAEVPLAMLVSDEQGRILLANPAMRNIVPEALLQPGASVQPLLEHLGLLSHNFALLAGKDHLVQATGRQQQTQNFIFRLASIVEGGDEPLWVLSLADVTEMRQFQSQRDQTLQLLSHDMRTPIASIIALSRSQGAAAESAGKAADIHRHARTLLNMMDDFIFSIHAQAPQYRRVELLIDNLVDEAVYQVRDLAQAKGMQIRVEQGDDPQFVMADPRLFTRVLVNLLINAVRYGEAGTPIGVRIGHDPVFEPHPMVRCSIVNTVAASAGQGGADTGRSFGLGLDFVRTVVQKHDGHFHARLPKLPGATAEVELALPLVQ